MALFRLEKSSDRLVQGILEDGTEGRSPSAYVHTDNVEILQLHQEDHASKDLAWIASYTNLIKPPSSYTHLIADIFNIPFKEAKIFSDARLEGMRKIHCKGKDHAIFVPEVDYAGIFSPWKAYRSMQSSVSRKVNQIKRLQDVDWHAKNRPDWFAKIVLTFPSEFRAIVHYDEDLAEALVHRIIKSFQKKMTVLCTKNNGNQLFVDYWYHPWSSRDPTKEPHPHVHVAMLNFSWNWKEMKGYRFRPWIDAMTLRQLWTETLVEEGAIHAGYQELAVGHISWARFNDSAKLTHWYRYCSRRPVQDMANYYEDHVHIPLTFDQKIFVEKLLDFVPRRRTYGAMTRLKSIVGEVCREQMCPMCATEGDNLGVVSLEGMKDLIQEGLPFYLFDKPSRRHLKVSSADAVAWIDRMSA